jgi:hypothetical protein
MRKRDKILRMDGLKMMKSQRSSNGIGNHKRIQSVKYGHQKYDYYSSHMRPDR